MRFCLSIYSNINLFFSHSALCLSVFLSLILSISSPSTSSPSPISPISPISFHLPHHISLFLPASFHGQAKYASAAQVAKLKKAVEAQRKRAEALANDPFLKPKDANKGKGGGKGGGNDKVYPAGAGDGDGGDGGDGGENPLQRPLVPLVPSVEVWKKQKDRERLTQRIEDKLLKEEKRREKQKKKREKRRNRKG